MSAEAGIDAHSSDALPIAFEKPTWELYAKVPYLGSACWVRAEDRLCVGGVGHYSRAWHIRCVYMRVPSADPDAVLGILYADFSLLLLLGILWLTGWPVYGLSEDRAWLDHACMFALWSCFSLDCRSDDFGLGFLPGHVRLRHPLLVQ